MTAPTISRRTFLTVGAAAGGGLLLGFSLLRGNRHGEESPAFAPNAFVRIDRQGQVTIIVPEVEMGQGTYTSIPMLVAEELEVDLSHVRVEHASADPARYGFDGDQSTGGSSSIIQAWPRMRTAGAAARMMLIAAAATRWGVDPDTCHAAHGAVLHPPSGQALGYGALVDTAATLGVPATIPLKDADHFSLIGTRAKRLDSANKVNGAARYGIDVRLEGMRVATVAACPVVGGSVARIDDSKARAIAGVRQVVRLADAVAVVGDHMWAAKQGLAALVITWNDGPHAGDTQAAIVRGHREAADSPAVVARATGDTVTALANAATRVDAEYAVQYLAHVTMEPMNCTVHVRSGACEVWTGSQAMGDARVAAAKAAGLSPDAVTVHNHFLGGGFGRRLETDYVTQAVLIGKQVGSPVKVVWTREEDMQLDYLRPYGYNRLAAGLDAHGRLVAWHHRIVGSSILARTQPADVTNGLDPTSVRDAAGVYDCPNILVDSVRHERAGIRTGYWRGVGHTHNIFVVESFIDELAHAAKQDPIAYRRAMLAGAPRARAVLDLVAEKSGWGRPTAARHGRGVSLQAAFGSFLAQVAEVAVTPDGTIRVERVVCAMDCGQVVNPDTIEAQLQGGVIMGASAALLEEITFSNGRVEQRNLTDYRVMRMPQAPVVEVHLVPSAESPGGIGETGTACIAAAVGNAIFAATGTRLRTLPLRLTPPAAAHTTQR
jgi:isoquinoline 1-oxidoreductase subunit beta